MQIAVRECSMHTLTYRTWTFLIKIESYVSTLEKNDSTMYFIRSRKHQRHSDFWYENGNYSMNKKSPLRKITYESSLSWVVKWTGWNDNHAKSPSARLYNGYHPILYNIDITNELCATCWSNGNITFNFIINIYTRLYS